MTFAALEERLGYRFRDKTLLRQALTHVSFHLPQEQPIHYQRLEFLGDRVLGLALSELLYERFPEASEGELSRRLAALVRKETCAEIATLWSVMTHILLGEKDLHKEGRHRISLLGDVCEAILGAIFLDSDYSNVREIIHRSWDKPLSSSPVSLQDSKTLLQEWAQKRAYPVPLYTVIQREGPDHAPAFTISVQVGKLPPTIGRGLSKRLAEQDAAAQMILRESIHKS